MRMKIAGFIEITHKDIDDYMQAYGEIETRAEAAIEIRKRVTEGIAVAWENLKNGL